MREFFIGKSALVTGASSGIGAATAALLAKHGAARLVLVDVAPVSSAQFGDGLEVVKIQGDVADPALWRDTATALGGLDFAVINAGISFAAPIIDHEFADWQRVMRTNVDGAFLTLQAAMRAMVAGGKGGAITLTASASAIKAEPSIAAYAASKAALLQLTRVAAQEGAPLGIRVNAVAPGGVDTPIWDAMPFFSDLVASEGSRDAAITAMAKMATPLGHYASAGEIAGQIAFLLSDAAASITGSTLLADGGYSL